MTDRQIYRTAGVCSLAAIAIFFIEFPFYLVRGAFPSMDQAAELPAYSARNATNIVSCLFLDLLILTLVMVFLAGLRHLLLRANPQHEWAATLFFGAGIAYVTLTLIADSLQAATVVDALSSPANPVIIRAMIESMYLMYGSVALWLMAVLMAIPAWVTMQSGALPRWSAWLGYACSASCLAFVPSMFVLHVDANGFYNPAGWGPLGIASGFPLAAWTIAMGVLLLRQPEPHSAGL
jgi:uncharacterized membrane protein